MKLPKGWKLEPLRWGVESLESGVSESGDDREPRANELAVLKVSAVTGGKFDPNQCKVIPEIASGRGRTSVRADSILVNRANGSAALVGSSVYVSEDHPNTLLPDKIWQITANSERSLGRFLHLITTTRRFKDELLNQCSGGTGMKNIGSARYLDIEVPFPPLPEQRKIADILSTWDEALETLDALIAAKDRQKQALMQQLLTGKTRVKGAKGKWKKLRFQELLKPEDRYVEFDDDHSYRLVSVRRRSVGVFFREELKGSEIKTKVMKRVHTNDFLISRMQVVHGALGMVRPECDGMFASDSYDVLVAKDATQLHMPFLGWMSRLQSFWHLAYISSHGVHIEKMTFKLSDFMHEKIFIPQDLAEQQQIAAILDTADQELTLLRTQRQTLDHQKRGLMQRLLTGKIRVNAAIK